MNYNKHMCLQKNYIFILNTYYLYLIFSLIIKIFF